MRFSARGWGLDPVRRCTRTNITFRRTCRQLTRGPERSSQHPCPRPPPGGQEEGPGILHPSLAEFGGARFRPCFSLVFVPSTEHTPVPRPPDSLPQSRKWCVRSAAGATPTADLLSSSCFEPVQAVPLSLGLGSHEPRPRGVVRTGDLRRLSIVPGCRLARDRGLVARRRGRE